VLRKIVSLLLCLLLPSLLLAGNPGAAIGNFNGEVSLNGRSVPSSTAIFPGDKLVTGRTGGAYIARPGFTMLVGSESSAELLTIGARVINGSAEATLKPGTEILYADLHITAASDFAKVKIETRPDGWMIGAYSGDLKVTDASTTVTVPQGKALYAKLKAEPRDKSTADTAAAASGGGGGHFKWYYGAIIGGAAAGGTIGGLYAAGVIGGCTPSVSPHRVC
jgi:hypothetical protein